MSELRNHSTQTAHKRSLLISNENILMENSKWQMSGSSQTEINSVSQEEREVEIESNNVIVDTPSNEEFEKDIATENSSNF